MVRYSFRAALGVGMATMGIFSVAGGGAAVADTPTGTCTNSYTAYSHHSDTDPSYLQLVSIDEGMSPQIFSLIDTNGNDIICFKPYPNGPHNGHGGNLVDDKAAPHT